MSWLRGGPPARSSSLTAAASATSRLVAMAEWCAERKGNPVIVQNGVMYRAHAAWLTIGGLGADES